MNAKQYKKLETPGIFWVEWKTGGSSVLDLHSPFIGTFTEDGLAFDRSYWACILRVIAYCPRKINESV